MVARLCQLMAEKFDVNPRRLSANTRLREDLKAGFLDFAELKMDLQDVLGITFDDEEFNKLNTIGELATYIEKYQ